MEHCGIWNRCILGFVELFYYLARLGPVVSTNHVQYAQTVSLESHFKHHVNKVRTDWLNIFICMVLLNSLWPSDAIWQHRSGSALARVMACCETAPSHYYLNQYWILISCFQWHSPVRNFTIVHECHLVFGDYTFKITTPFHRNSQSYKTSLYAGVSLRMYNQGLW